MRPRGTRYVGVDVRESALRAAPPGSFDEVWTLDICDERIAKLGPFDLAVSWQALEHVRPLAVALENVRQSLRPGGKFVALLSGRYALFSIANRLLPTRFGVSFMQHLLRRPPDTVFKAFYDACSASALWRLLETWSQANVTPLYRGAEYLTFAPRLQRFYVRYESWAREGAHANLATHYLVEAVR